MTFLETLDNLIADRQKARPEGSYTSKLFQQGVDRICRKVGEESSELIIAAKNHDAEEMKNEAADLLFHVMVLLRNENIALSDVVETLQSRHG